ncbi:MAG: hypothetical protein ACREXJ_00260 [Gammaproteobacteria bacterium]
MPERRWTWHSQVRGRAPNGEPADVHIRATPDGDIEIETDGPVRLQPETAQHLRHKIGHAMGSALRGVRWL